ncbi:MAG TPA: hypothetical protein VG326_15655 [Tepidisphaeraceae bacterium]|jgi:hypothetical protein|nr:hypothetical protein [Tepidisphaeraceae bacterium]
MVKHPIGNDWSIMADEKFTRRVVDGDVIFQMLSRTIYCSIFNTNDTAADEAIQKMIEGRPGIPVQIFDREEPGLAGHAYLLPEGKKDAGYWGLNTWTAARGSVCCVTIYFHDLDDFNWAISVWKSVRPGRESKGGLN